MRKRLENFGFNEIALVLHRCLWQYLKSDLSLLYSTDETRYSIGDVFAGDCRCSTLPVG